MTDEKGVTPEVQAVVTTGAAGATQQVQATGETPEQLRASIAKLEAALKDTNKESAARRKRLEELESQEAARVEQGKTESQKLADQLAKLQAERDGALTRASETLIRSGVITEASKLQFRDPSDALPFIDKSKLKINDDGTIEGLEQQLAAIAKNKPYLLSTSILGAQSPSNPGNGAQANGETRAQKLARLYGGSSGQSLGGGYVPIKD
jgi:ribosomal protein L17